MFAPDPDLLWLVSCSYSCRCCPPPHSCFWKPFQDEINSAPTPATQKLKSPEQPFHEALRLRRPHALQGNRLDLGCWAVDAEHTNIADPKEASVVVVLSPVLAELVVLSCRHPFTNLH